MNKPDMFQQSYDQFSAVYDKFVDWEARLDYELPFIVEQLGSVGGDHPVLDVACGTGMHAIALAKRGFKIIGTDLSKGMVERARENAAAVHLDIQFEQVGFGMLAPMFGEEKFGAVLCLGNSLPHILNKQNLVDTLLDFGKVLKQGGLLLVQNRNFDVVKARQDRWMEPQAHQKGMEQWLFFRFYDFLPDGTIDFNIITFYQKECGSWMQSITTTRLYPWLKDEITHLLQETGFAKIRFYGDLAGSSYRKSSSGNLVMTANKKRS